MTILSLALAAWGFIAVSVSAALIIRDNARRRALRRRMWQVMDALAEQTRRAGIRRW